MYKIFYIFDISKQNKQENGISKKVNRRNTRVKNSVC